MAKNNATSPKPGGSAPSCTAENTPQHKLLAMGKDATRSGDGKKTKA